MSDLTDCEIEALGRMRDGWLVKTAAPELGMTEKMFKYRLERARNKLNAKTNIQAVAIAIGTNQIEAPTA